VTTDERLGRIEAKLDSLTETLASSCALHDACRNQQREHHGTLYGNGKEGLAARVQSLEHSRWLIRVGFTGLWAVALAGVAAFFKWIAKAF